MTSFSRSTMYREVVFACWILIAVTSVSAKDVGEGNFAAHVNCSSVRSTFSWVQKCLDLYNIPFSLPDPDLLSNSSTATQEIFSLMQQADTNTTATLCRPENKENFIKGVICINGINKKCAAVNPVLQAVMQSNQDVRQRVEFGCQTIGEYNIECVKAKMEEIKKCVNVGAIVAGLGKDNSTNAKDLLNRSLCASYELSRVCATKHLKSCGESTVQMYEQNLPKMEICKNFTGLNTLTDNEMTVDCSSTWSVRKSYLTCQVNAGIFLLLPERETSDELSELILRSITLDKSQEMCKTLEQYSEFVNCTLSVHRDCSPDSMKPTVPDTQSVQRGLRKLCQNIDGFDSTCVSEATVSACRGRKRRSVAQRSMLKYLCRDTIDHNKCLVDSVKRCGDVTSSQYGDILSAQLPEMCLGYKAKTTTNSAFRATVTFVLLIFTVTILC